MFEAGAQGGSERIIRSLPAGQVVAACFTKNQMEVQRSQTRMKGRGARLASKGLRLPRGEVPDRGCLRIVTLNRTVTLSWAGLRSASGMHLPCYRRQVPSCA